MEKTNITPQGESHNAPLRAPEQPEAEDPSSIKQHLLGSVTQEIMYTKDRPFSFPDKEPSERSILLPSQYPIPPTPNTHPLTPALTYNIRGEIPETTQEFEQRRMQIANDGFFQVPDLFLTNSSTRIPSNLKKREIVSTVEQIEKCEFPEEIIHVTLSNVHLQLQQMFSIFRKLTDFTKIEVLNLNNTGISKPPKETFPTLRIASFVDNRMKEPLYLVEFATRHINLSVLDYRRNPVSANDRGFQEILAKAVNLRFVNGRQISVADRVRAMERSKFSPAVIPKIHFILQVREVPEISVLTKWDPRMIAHLSLPKCGLESLSLHSFNSLISLNLSGNNIKSLKGSGIVLCKKLISLDLSRNCISDMAEVDCFRYCDSLLHLWLSDNPMGHYRPAAILVCSSLAGTSAKRGLSTLDGLAVTIEETLRALHTIGSKVDELPQMKWMANLQRSVGNLSFLSKVASITFDNRALRLVNMQEMTTITHISLRNNVFESISGLSMCVNLILLDISGNYSLNLRKVLPEIVKLKKLQYLMLATDCWDNDSFSFSENSPNLSVRNRDYRERVLMLLLREICCLTSLDRLKISVNERLSIIESFVTSDLEDYRVFLSILQAAIPEKWADLSAAAVLPGRQYNPSEITTLRDLCGCSLSNRASLRFDAFVNLEELDLSHNRIISIPPLGLESLKKLRIVDLSYNRISDSPEVIGRIIDSIQSLEMISLRGNPTMEEEGMRLRLISKISRLQTLKDCFRVIDYEVSPLDIIRTRNWPPEATEIERMKGMFLLSLKIRLQPHADLKNLSELNLSNCNLRAVDIKKFTSLKRLSLAGNQISCEDDIIGLPSVIGLEILDLRFNVIEHAKPIIMIIKLLPNLLSIGVEGNPLCAKKNYRMKILNHIPGISDPKYPFMAIDDKLISSDEIKSIVSFGDKDYDKFAFELAVQRSVVNEGINLSRCDIGSFLEFSTFKSLKWLSLAHNRITVADLVSSGLSECHDLERIDISDNQIRDSSGALARFLSGFKHLKSLNIALNPICPKASGWRQFLIFFEGIKDPESEFTTINGHALSAEDRVSIIEESESNSGEFRTKLALFNSQKNWIEARQISLPKLSLVSIESIGLAASLQILNVSHNSIRFLPRFSSLKSLKLLDIRDNQLESLEQTVESLTELPNLEVIFLQFSTREKADTSDPKKYIAFVSMILRGLTEIDLMKNPRPLRQQQLNAIKDLQQLTNWYNPNHLRSIDLSSRGIEERDFLNVLGTLSSLAPKEVRFTGNPCAEIEKYRFTVIYNLPEIEILDGELVTVDQKLNADKVIRASKLANADVVAANVGAFAAEYFDKDNRESLVSNFKTASSLIAKYGTALMKWEIFITFEQILTQLMTLVDRIKWPTIYIQLSYILSPLSIDLSFLNYLLYIQMPFWFEYLSFFLYVLLPAVLFGIYHMQPSKEHWYQAFIGNWGRTKNLSLIALIIMCICSAGLALLSDFSYSYYTLSVTNNQLAWLTVLCAVSIVLVCIFLIIGCIFRSHASDPILWFKVLKAKKRFALFLLTVLYYPVCKEFVSIFQCLDGHSKSFNGVGCFQTFDSLQLVHICAAVFFIVYSIGIPIFFIKLINKGVKEIDLSYRIDKRLAEIEVKEKEAKEKEMKEMLKKQRKEVNQSYSKAAIEYENAAAYLYNGYDRKHRFKKVLSMVEKLAYLLFSSFDIDGKILSSIKVKAVLNGSLLGVTSFFQLIANPFAAFSENLMEGFGKIGNCVAFVIGQDLQLNILAFLHISSTVLGIILVSAIALLVVIFIIILVKNHCCCKKKEDDSSDEDVAIDKSGPKEGDPNEIERNMRSLNIGSDFSAFGASIEFIDRPNAFNELEADSPMLEDQNNVDTQFISEMPKNAAPIGDDAEEIEKLATV